MDGCRDHTLSAVALQQPSRGRLSRYWRPYIQSCNVCMIIYLYMYI